MGVVLKVVEHSISLLVLLGSEEEHDALERSHQVLFLHCSLHEIHIDVVVDDMLHNIERVDVDVDVVELLSVDILAPAAADVDDRQHHVGHRVEGFPVYVGYY